MGKDIVYYVDKIFDMLMFREGSEEDSHSTAPLVTFGTIIWGLILRISMIITVFFLMVQYAKMPYNWWIVIFMIWVFAAYPAYRQYVKFDERMKEFSESTLCGSCKYFDKEAQLCRIYDEHVSYEHIPCEGESWEPK